MSSNEVSIDTVVNDVLNSMSKSLDNEQLLQLKNSLYISLHDIQLNRITYELTTTIENNDAKIMDYFSISLKTANKSDKTIKQYTSAAWRLRNFANKNFKDITHVDIKFYFATKQREGLWNDISTENQYNYINQFFEFLCDEDFIDKNPMRKITKVKVHKKLRKPYSVSEIEKMRNTVNNDVRKLAMIEFFLSTALRVESVQRLKWKDLDFNKKQVITVVKGGDTKIFRYNEKAEFYLLKYLDERMIKEHRTREEMLERPLFAEKKRNKITKDYDALSTGGIRYIMKTIGRDAHVNKVHPHRFRKTFACNAIAHGMPMEEVKEHLGHKNIQTTFVYADLTDTKLENSYRTYCE